MLNPNHLAIKVPAFLLAAAVGGTTLSACGGSDKQSVSPPAAEANCLDPNNPLPIQSAAEGEAPSPPSKVYKYDPATSFGKILLAQGTEGNHNIKLKDLHTGEITDITKGPNDHLNPQVRGNEVLITGNDTGQYQVYRFSLDKPNNKEQITDSDARNDDPAWLGSKILFKSSVGSGDIFVIPEEGAEPQNLTPNTETTEQWRAVDGGENRVVLTTRHSDDGTMNRKQLSATDEIVLINTANPNAKPQCLTHNTWADWYPSVRDGIVAFTSKEASNPEGNDAIKQLDLNNPIKLPELLVKLRGDSSDPEWASNGTLLFVNNSSGKYRPMARTPNGRIYDLGDTNQKGEVLSPVAVGEITVNGQG